MAITLYFSGGSANSDPSIAIGGAKSSVAVGSRIFGPIPQAQFTAGAVLYRCVYVATDAVLEGLKVWIGSETPSANTTLALGWGVAAINATETAIANQTTAPAGVTFTAPASLAAATSGGDFAAGQFRALWLRYTITATSPIASETFSLQAGGTEGTSSNNLIINGDFTTNTSNWTPSESALSIVSGKLRVTNNVAGYGGGYQDVIGLTVGVNYQFTWEPGATNLSYGPYVHLGTPANSSAYFNAATSSPLQFTATATTARIWLNAGENANGTYSEYDNLVLVALAPTQTFSSGVELAGVAAYDYQMTVRPDPAMTGTVTRQWEQSDNGSTGWTNISSQTGLTYTPAAGLLNKYIRVTTTNGTDTAISSVIGPLVAPATLRTASNAYAAALGPGVNADSASSSRNIYVWAKSDGTTSGGVETTFSTADIDRAKAAGAAHIRFSARWSNHAAVTADATLESGFLAYAKSIIDYAIAQGLKVIGTFGHHYKQFEGTTPLDFMEASVAAGVVDTRMYNIVRQLAQQFSYVSNDNLAWEFYNEPWNRFDASPAVWEGVAAEIWKAFRAYDRTRTLIWPGNGQGSVRGLTACAPPADPTLCYVAHNYEPYTFTHAGFGGNPARAWDTTADTGAIYTQAAFAKRLSIDKAVPILITEVGSATINAVADREAAASANMRAHRSMGLPYSVWSTSIDFGLWYKNGSAPVTAFGNLPTLALDKTTDITAHTLAVDAATEDSRTIAFVVPGSGALHANSVGNANVSLNGGLTAAVAYTGGLIHVGQTADKSLSIARTAMAYNATTGAKLVMQIGFVWPAPAATLRLFEYGNYGSGGTYGAYITTAGRLEAFCVNNYISQAIDNQVKAGERAYLTYSYDGATGVLHVTLQGQTWGRQTVPVGDRPTIAMNHYFYFCGGDNAGAGATTPASYGGLPLDIVSARVYVIPSASAMHPIAHAKFLLSPTGRIANLSAL